MSVPSPVVTLGGLSVTLETPRAMGLCLGMLLRPTAAREAQPHRLMPDAVGVLALCWPHARVPSWGAWPVPAPGQGPDSYGDAALVAALAGVEARAFTLHEVNAAGMAAFTWMASRWVPPAEELEAARGNSEAPTGASSGG